MTPSTSPGGGEVAQSVYCSMATGKVAPADGG